MLGFTPDWTVKMAKCSTGVKSIGACLGFEAVDGFPVGVVFRGVFLFAMEYSSELYSLVDLGDFIVSFDFLGGFALLTFLAIDVTAIDVFLGGGFFEVFSRVDS